MYWTQSALVLLGRFAPIAFHFPSAASSSLALTTAVLLLPLAQAAYVLEDDFSGDAFFQNFDFFTGADPTHGHVQYQSLAEANASGLAGFVNGGSGTKAVYMGVDTKSQAPQGRGSVRVQSQKSYQHALVIADILHMPGGICGTWPAFWMVGPNWPVNGEIDIIEGVNDQSSNQMTLHTNAGAVISKQATDSFGSSKVAETFTGSLITPNCDVNAPGQSQNAGCAIADNSGLTFGTTFNSNGGGVVAMEWTSEAISIWMFQRGSIPSDISSSQPNPSANWGAPTSIFSGNFNMDDHFKNLNLVFDTTFCGDWAGNTWNAAGSKCAALAPTCEQYVTNNPSAFTEAYWAINSLKVFQDNGQNAAAAATPTAASGQQPQQVGGSSPTTTTNAAAAVVTVVTVTQGAAAQTFQTAAPPAATGGYPFGNYGRPNSGSWFQPNHGQGQKRSWWPSSDSIRRTLGRRSGGSVLPLGLTN